MIVVIADDLSGAAEMAGLGWRFGLRTQIQQRFDAAVDADLLVVNTRSRAMPVQAAQDTCEAVAYRISQSRVERCYKKVDSVLRGHVYAELYACMSRLNKPNAILAPANPSRGRTIVDGCYLIDGRPLDETDFANDPEYPVTSCRILDLVKSQGECPVYSARHDQYAPEKVGIWVAELAQAEDLGQWAGCLNDDTLAAGGADFFGACLEHWRSASQDRKPLDMEAMTGQTLFVCGSTSRQARAAVGEAEAMGIPICPMPEPLVQGYTTDEQAMDLWTRTVLEALHGQGCAVVTVDHPIIHDAEKAGQLAFHMACLVECIVDRVNLSELFVSGGGTADAIIERMAWDTLNVLGEYQAGVVCAGIAGTEGPTVTIKPGSYAWPENIWTRCKEGMSYAK